MKRRGSAPGERRGGRQKGTPNKLTADVKTLLMGALDELGGQAYLVKQGRANPTAFLSLLGRVLPRQIDAKVEGTFHGYEPQRIPVEEREPAPVARSDGSAA